MRYLIHSEDCTFDTATGIYTMSADRRLANPVSLKIQSFVYQAPTLASYPLAVYVSSGGINDMTAKKHTLQLTENNHENETDIICVLTESNTTGRYKLTVPRRFPLKQYTYVRNFDFKFTDNNTVRLRRIKRLIILTPRRPKKKRERFSDHSIPAARRGTTE